MKKVFALTIFEIQRSFRPPIYNCSKKVLPPIIYENCLKNSPSPKLLSTVKVLTLLNHPCENVLAPQYSV